MANLRYSSIKNDFSLVFDTCATIVECGDDENIQSNCYNFLTISQIKDTVGMQTVDFIGVGQ